MAIVSTGSHKLFKITTVDDSTTYPLAADALNPVMFDHDDNEGLFIVDGHAWDAASICRVIDVLEGSTGVLTENTPGVKYTGEGGVVVEELTAFAALA